MKNNTFYQKLINNHQVEKIHNQNEINNLINKEQLSLKLLRNKNLFNQYDCYLNFYDRIFRHVCLHLLGHNLKITDNHPHQTLITILENKYPKDDLILMVSLRHKIKKKINFYQQDFNIKSCELMLDILNDYSKNDAQDCQSFLQSL